MAQVCKGPVRRMIVADFKAGEERAMKVKTVGDGGTSAEVGGQWGGVRQEEEEQA